MNNRNMVLGKDGQANSVGDVISNVGSPMQSAGMPRTDTDMLMKVQLTPLLQVVISVAL